ncbi:diguanylate cyclase [Pseudomonas alloputida]|uniref:Diguanylate cyclase n=2 Tax=Pseudomonas TaxID=286 RepID=A0ABD6N229_9PSED|nr:diguanylate cyclase [Pseudomonas hunanensis]PTV60306.1 diguanylate cyclase [Pseudomonas putida]TRZ63664.1 diguanylate cyclase [Pseudomonas alloputida]
MVGAGLPANTGAAGAMPRFTCFAGKPAQSAEPCGPAQTMLIAARSASR